jgi:D-psicose/D-tagatose/L-ribulose 3-epimerase
MGSDATNTSTLFGLCSWTLGLEDIEKILEATKRFGLDGLQFHGDHASHDPRTLKAAAAQRGLQLFAIDPIRCKPEHDQANADQGVAYYRKVVDFAEQAGCRAVTVHGLGYWCQDASDRPGALTHLVGGLQALCEYAGPKGIRILWEMCNRYEVPMARTCREGRQLKSLVQRENFALILDSFHMNIEDRDGTSEITATGPDIAIYHVSDSNRGGIGSGHIDFAAHHQALRAVGFRSPVMLEFVLPGRGPHTPPEAANDWVALELEFTRSLAQWRKFDAS